MVIILLIAIGCGLKEIFDLFIYATNFESLYEGVFDRFLIHYVFLPLTIVAGSVMTQYRLGDSFICQKRSVLYYQTCFQNIMTTLIIWLGWSLVSIVLVLIRFQLHVPVEFFIANVLGFIYLLLVQLLFVSGSLGIYFLLNNKVVSVMTMLIINIGIFEASMRGVSTLIYDFSTLGGVSVRVGQLLILISLITILNLLTYWLVLKREF